MLLNYLKIAWRNLWKNKSYPLINILGMSASIACAILIYGLVSYQLSFDNFHHNGDRIYRMVSEYHMDDIEYQQGVPQPVGKAFRNDYAFAEQSARVVFYNNALISLPGDKEMRKFQEEDGVAYAEPGYFDIFNFPLVEGDRQHILTEPNTAVITRQVADKYFGKEDAIGKLIRYNNQTDFRITGILKDIPGNTDRRQEIYLSYANLRDKDAWFASDSSWGSVSGSMQFFLRLRPGVSPATVEKQLPSFIKKYYTGEDARTGQLNLQPLADIHFNANYNGQASKSNLWALSLIGIFLVITACVNFINLATARALLRGKEIGVRKVMGSLRAQLFWQFMLETSLIVVASIVAGYAIAYATLPVLNDQLGLRIVMDIWKDPGILLFLILLSIVVVFLAGAYPGLVLSRFKPIAALKGKLTQRHVGGFPLRRILVVVQFSIAQMLIIGLIVIAGQLHYSTTKDLGFRKKGIVLLPIPVNDEVKINSLRARLASVNGTGTVTLCSQPPASGSVTYTDIRYDNRPKNETWEVNEKFADAAYMTTFNLKLVAGRNFFAAGDTAREILVNERFVNRLGVRDPATVIGQKVSLNSGKGEWVTIAGVVKDFYDNSLRKTMGPVMILPDYERYRWCAAEFQSAELGRAMAAYEKAWNATFGDYVFSYQFLDERIDKFYRKDLVMLHLIEGFAAIAILISCMGLYGLVSFMAVQRNKEIGVRKVLGARLDSILWLFGQELCRLLLIAFVIAAPVAGWVTYSWLQDFQYRIALSPAVFIAALLATLVISLLTVGWRSMRAATANPIKSLRSE